MRNDAESLVVAAPELLYRSGDDILRRIRQTVFLFQIFILGFPVGAKPLCNAFN